MDLTQSKLSKQEWQTTEIPVSEQEASILQLIMQGYENPDIRMNLNLSLAGFMKIPEDQRSALEPHLFQTFFAPLTASHPVPNSLQKDVVKGGKKLVCRIGSGFYQRVKQRRFTCVGIAN
jgi:hypothetical protein